MTDRRRRFRLRRAPLLGGVLAAGLLVGGAGGPARADAPATACSPPCAAGQVCLQGSCWIQAPTASPPPPSDSQPAPAVPPGSYPSPNSYPPPPGGYPPPNFYPPPNSYSYPPSPPDSRYPTYPPPRRPRQRIFQLIPYAGVHSYHGDGAANIGPGLHLGGLVGFRFQEVVSINGELTLDSLGLSNLPVGDKLSEFDLVATISPLYSVIDGKLEVAFGPKIGFWLGSYDQTSASRGDGYGSFSGLDLGANLAVMGQVGRHLWLGGLASFDVRTFRSSCFSPTYGKETCAKGDLPPADEVLALSLLLMFSI